jgi:hypothetical protein
MAIMLRTTTAGGLLLVMTACASGGGRRPVAAELPRGVRLSEVCGEGDVIPRLRVRGMDAHGAALSDAEVEIRDGPRLVTGGRVDEDGTALFAVEARRYTVVWQRRGFVPPGPFPVLAKRGCEVQVVVQAEPVG